MLLLVRCLLDYSGGVGTFYCLYLGTCGEFEARGEVKQVHNLFGSVGFSSKDQHFFLTLYSGARLDAPASKQEKLDVADPRRRLEEQYQTLETKVQILTCPSLVHIYKSSIHQKMSKFHFISVS